MILLAWQIMSKKNTTCVDLNTVTRSLMHITATQDPTQTKPITKTNPNKEATDVESVKTCKTSRLF